MEHSASQRGLNPWKTIFYTFGFAVLFLLTFNLLPWEILPGAAMRASDLFWLGNALPGWGFLFLLAVGPTRLGLGLYNTGLSYLSSSVANLNVTLESPFTAIIAYFLLDERLTWMQIIGGLFIMTGVVSLRVSEGRFAHQAESEIQARVPNSTSTESWHEPYPEMP